MLCPSLHKAYERVAMQISYPQSPFRDLVDGAGIGTWIWSQTSYYAATYYHLVVALFTAFILAVILIPLVGLQFAAFCLLVYGVYFFVRKRLPFNLEKKFYTPSIQFMRAQTGFVFITLLLLIPGVERTSLWLLYVPVILLTSKHCRTLWFNILLTQSICALIGIRLSQASAYSTFFDFILANLDLPAQILWLGFFAFVFHFLVRNIQARDEAIAGYKAVSALTADVDMTDIRNLAQWQPLLTACLKYLGGACASVWITNAKKRQMQLIASARRDTKKRETFVFDNSSQTILLNSAALIASVARNGEPDQVIFPVIAGMPVCDTRCCPLCGEIAAELAVPINLGGCRQRYTIGVISVGFGSASFRPEMLAQYQNFTQALVNQAKPILAYAQRLDELIVLQRISEQVSHSLDLNHVLDSILRSIVDTLGFEFALISLVDEERRIITARRGINVPQKWLEMAAHSLDSHDIQADIVRTGKTEILSEWDARFDRKIWNKFNHKDLIRIFMPINVVDQATSQECSIGTIEAGYNRATRAEIDENQKRMLHALKNQAAIAIAHAQLLERMQKNNKVLTSLHNVGQVIGSARNPTQVLEEIGLSAAMLLDADPVMLYRYHRDRDIVDPPVINGDAGNNFRANLDLSQPSILRHLLKEQPQPFYSPDARTDPLLLSDASLQATNQAGVKYTFIARHNIKSFAGIPLVAQGETVGVMFVNYRSRHTFDEDEKQIHELLAQQAAVAIKNAGINELEREVIVREERNRLSRELHHSVSQALYGIQVQAQNGINALRRGVEQARMDFSNILEIANLASVETGFIMGELRSPIEASQGLKVGLDAYVRRIQSWYPKEIILDLDLQVPVAPRCEQELLRFAREAVTNAIRHARCNKISVNCRTDLGGLWLSVQDDGIGFDPQRISRRKLGLQSMSEIAHALEGTFELETRPGGGTRIGMRVLSEDEWSEDA